MKIVVNGQICNIVTYSSSTGETAPQNAIIVIHGMKRNAHDYFNSMHNAAQIANSSNTLIIAPQFSTSEDLITQPTVDNPLYWSSEGWKIGNKSLGENRISSFSAVEQIISQVVCANPYLETITIIGHSAGGQFVNRFAAGNSVEDSFPNIHFRYGVANPSSYLYFSPERAVPGISNLFQIPVTPCASYDEYKYGLSSIPNTGYMSQLGKHELTKRFQRREVSYFLGSDDTQKDEGLDTSAPAMLQGKNRFERGIIYLNHLVKCFGREILNRHSLSILPNVGHNYQHVFSASACLNYLFNPRPKPANLSSSAVTRPVLMSIEAQQLRPPIPIRSISDTIKTHADRPHK